MRALVMKRAWRLQVEEVPVPDLAPDEVLLEVVATGVCGSDVHGFTGENGRRFPGQVMGHETVGRIVALGRDVARRSGGAGHGLDEGMPATVNPLVSCGRCGSCRADVPQRCPSRRVIGVDPALCSAFAELMAAPARNVVPLPDGMPEEHGALVEPLAVGYHAAVRGGCGAGDRVLVIGGGPIGQAAALGALRLGAPRVVVSEPRPGRRALLRRLGLTAVDPGPRALAELAPQVLGGRPTLVLDAVGAAGTAAEALAVSEPGARVVLVGMHAPRLDLRAYALSTEERSLVGSFCYSAREFEQTARWAAGTGYDLSALVGSRVGLEEAPGSFAALARGEGGAGKVLVRPNGAPGPAPRPGGPSQEVRR